MIAGIIGTVLLFIIIGIALVIGIVVALMKRVAGAGRRPRRDL
jgi:hypothetical protein